MTKRDFFRVIIKLFGLYQMLIVIFQGIPSFIETGIFLEGFLSLFAYSVLILAVAIGVFSLLIFKVDTIIDWLKLDSGFEDAHLHFESFDAQQLIKFAIILIGGLMLLNNLSEFLQLSVHFFKEKAGEGFSSSLSMLGTTTFDYVNWVVTGLNIIVAYFLLTNYKTVTNWLNLEPKSDLK